MLFRSVLVDETVVVADLVAVHAVAVLYLLACAGVGLLASVAFDSIRRAQTAGVGAVFGMIVLDSITVGTDYEALGDVAFSRHFDPGTILVDGTVEWTGVVVLTVATAGLAAASALLFERTDVPA